MKKCLVCEHPVDEFISFGKMPVANGFLLPEQISSEYFFELKVGFCPECKMVQLTEIVDQEKMFHENYAFFSSTSAYMKAHFARYADYILAEHCKNEKDPFIVEMGSNDGIMLQNFADKKIRHLGIEPSKNVAQVAIEKGINTVSEFFDEQLAEKIIAQHGQADVFAAANVMCHIPYINSIFRGVKKLLKPTGVLMFEDPYLGDIISKTSYDQVYDEHAFYFSCLSVQILAERNGLELFDILPQKVHGGELRYIIGHKGAHTVTQRVIDQVKAEKEQGLDKMETFHQFRKNVEQSRANLMKVLNDLKSKGKRVVAYGATSKSTTVTNYCGITPEHIEFISDVTPIKQGKLSPGAHIPVKPYQAFRDNMPEYTLLFAWNHAEEIREKEKEYQAQGGKWIMYVPKVEIVS